MDDAIHRVNRIMFCKQFHLVNSVIHVAQIVFKRVTSQNNKPSKS